MLRTWEIDSSHSSVEFIVKHMVISKVRGRFGQFSGTIRFDPEALDQSFVRVDIDVASLDTRSEQRDAHLRSADFFDVASHPKAMFASTAIERSGRGWKVTGDLTLRGTTRPVVLDAELGGTGKDPWGNERASFSARTRLNRTDYGLKWNQALETGGVLVSENVDLEIELSAVAKPAA